MYITFLFGNQIHPGYEHTVFFAGEQLNKVGINNKLLISYINNGLSERKTKTKEFEEQIKDNLSKLYNDLINPESEINKGKDKTGFEVIKKSYLLESHMLIKLFEDKNRRK